MQSRHSQKIVISFANLSSRSVKRRWPLGSAFLGMFLFRCGRPDVAADLVCEFFKIASPDR